MLLKAPLRASVLFLIVAGIHIVLTPKFNVYFLGKPVHVTASLASFSSNGVPVPPGLLSLFQQPVNIQNVADWHIYSHAGCSR